MTKRHKQKCSQGCSKNAVARGLCDTCYRRLKKYGTLKTQKIEDLPEEKWAEVNGCPGWFISTHGRVKSTKSPVAEKLIKINFSKADGIHKCLNFRDRRSSGKVFRVHQEVLKAFVPNPENDTRAVFKDGDITNCHVNNLAWMGRDYLVPLAIEMAKKNSNPYAKSFIDFWRGNKNALNQFWLSMEPRIAGYLRKRADRLNMFWLDIGGLVQETIVEGFLAIRRGMIKDLDNIFGYFCYIAKNVLAKRGRRYGQLPTVSQFWTPPGIDTKSFCIIDASGFTHPSAELSAIFREEFDVYHSHGQQN